MGKSLARKHIGDIDMADAKLLAVALWEAVADLDQIDQTPHGQVSKLLDSLSAKLVRAAIDAEALAREAPNA